MINSELLTRNEIVKGSNNVSPREMFAPLFVPHSSMPKGLRYGSRYSEGSPLLGLKICRRVWRSAEGKS